MDTNARFFVLSTHPTNESEWDFQGHEERDSAIAAVESNLAEGRTVRLFAGRELEFRRGGVQIVRQRRERKPAATAKPKRTRAAKANSPAPATRTAKRRAEAATPDRFATSLIVIRSLMPAGKQESPLTSSSLELVT